MVLLPNLPWLCPPFYCDTPFAEWIQIAFDRKTTLNILITAPSLARANLPGYRGRRAQRRDRRQLRPRQGHDSNEKRIGVIVGFKSHYSFSCDILHLWIMIWSQFFFNWIRSPRIDPANETVLRTLLYFCYHHWNTAENLLHSPAALRKVPWGWLLDEVLNLLQVIWRLKKVNGWR